MTEINYLAVLVATVTAFVVSSAWYMAFAGVWARLSTAGAAVAGERPAPWKMGVEFLRTLVVVAVFAGLTAAIGADGLPGVLGLALVVWLGFPLVLLSGSVLHENTPVRLAALHAGDWLVKLLAIAVVIGVWR
jgi:hypothetical protein